MIIDINDNSVIHLIDNAIGSEGAHYDVAKLIYFIYKDEYKTINKYNSNKWIYTEEGLNLRKSLSEEICGLFLERAMYYNSISSNPIYNQSQQNDYNKRGIEAQKIGLKLKQTSYKDAIMKECKFLFI